MTHTYAGYPRFSMAAIKTRWMRPTNKRGSRVKATCQAGSVTLSWDDSLNTDGNHQAAANALLRKVGWTREGGATYAPMVGGCIDGDYYWVFESGPIADGSETP